MRLLSSGGTALGAGDAPTSTDWQQAFSQDRQLGNDFAVNQPFFGLILMRLMLCVLAPLDTYALTVCGEDWEKEQRVKELNAINSGTDCLAREYRVTIAAKQLPEKASFKHLKLLYDDPELWVLVPRCKFTESTNTFTFKSLSKLGCLIEELVASEHAKYDFKTFLLVHCYNDVVDDIEYDLKKEPCKFGPFSSRFFIDDQNKLDCPHLRPRLAFCAYMLRTSMASLEALHATVRRWLVRLSVQTHARDMKQSAAQAVACNIHRRVGKSTVRCMPSFQAPTTDTTPATPARLDTSAVPVEDAEVPQ